MIQTGGGTFDSQDRYIYFAAGSAYASDKKTAFLNYDYVLIAVNELFDDRPLENFELMLDLGKKVLLDSGIFNLTNQHARAHNCTMDEALAIPPQGIDGFQKLYDRYVELVKRYEKRLWGYIELDQGGRACKIETRKGLEKIGLRPMPVYHPLNDGWDYFDELAKRYDRICFGNIVQAERAVRKRLLATLWQRHRAYPGLWVHALGLTPNEMLLAFPMESCDSSTWLSSVRWGQVSSSVCLRRNLTLHHNFNYKLKDQETWLASQMMMLKEAKAANENWKAYMRSMEGHGIPVLPSL